MSTSSIKNYLINNHNDIIKLLEQSGFYNISFIHYRNEIRCATHLGGNPTAVKIDCETLSGICFNEDISGNIITLIMKHNCWDFVFTLNHIKSVLNISIDNRARPFFGGAYNSISSFIKDEEEELFYNYNELNKFMNIPNIRFLKDNISIEVQKRFKLGFDTETQRISVPWFNEKGKLVGVTGRYNYDDCGEIPKWKPILNFKKGDYLYGLHENYQDIKDKGYVIIGESEKMVMQLATYGYNVGLALGGCVITKKQSQIIKSLPINNIILALDEGLNVEHILNQANKLKDGIFNSKNVYVLYDKNNEILEKNSKNSPTDLGKDKFKYLMKNYLYKKE